MDRIDEKRLFDLIRKDTKETRRLEFKQRLELGTPSAKSEFVRDVIALANSEGECPRDPAHYVIGVKRGKVFDVTSAHLDGATLSDILDALVSPPLELRYEELGPRRKRIGVLTITSDERVLYVVKADHYDHNGAKVLVAGQSWGRKGDKKVRLSGDQIAERVSHNLRRATAVVLAPLQRRIAHLEDVLKQTGPVAEVRRVRYAIEFEFDWMKIRDTLASLVPYAREFDVDVGVEVVRTAEYAAGRISHKTPAAAIRTIFEVLRECLKLNWGEISGIETRTVSEEELSLLLRATQLGLHVTSDAIVRTKNAEVIRAGQDFLTPILMYARSAGLGSLKDDLSSRLSSMVQLCKKSENPNVAEIAPTLKSSIEYAVMSPAKRRALHSKRIRELERRDRRRVSSERQRHRRCD